ncbi:MAG: TIGR00282 family metallophosphoesterase [Opitutales bacterium]
MRLLFLGDIVGKPGRRYLKQRLARLREELRADLVVVNGENSAGGSGLTGAMAEELHGAGADVITLGDHVWDQRGFDGEIDRLERVCRPANLPENCPGKRFVVAEAAGLRLGVFTVLGRTFMNMKAECPFLCADRMLQNHRDAADVWFVEAHAETTSEKCALGWYLDGRASLVAGTHTHIPTADGRILPRGTAYITDVGMSGPYASCLGRDIQPVILRFLDGMPRRFTVAEEDVRLCGCLVQIDPKSGAATHFERVEVREVDEPAPRPDQADSNDADTPADANSEAEAESMA